MSSKLSNASLPGRTKKGSCLERIDNSTEILGSSAFGKGHKPCIQAFGVNICVFQELLQQKGASPWLCGDPADMEQQACGRPQNTLYKANTFYWLQWGGNMNWINVGMSHFGKRALVPTSLICWKTMRCLSIKSTALLFAKLLRAYINKREAWMRGQQ